MDLTDKEKKLLCLALNASAQPGEMVNAAVKLIEHWRKRDLSVQDFEQRAPVVLARPERKFYRPDYGLCIWPWPRQKDGPYKGKLFKDIPPAYLKGQLKWIKSDPERANKFAELVTQIENFLNQ